MFSVWKSQTHTSTGVSTSIKAEVLAVCQCGAFRCELSQSQEGKTSAILEKQLLLPVNMVWVTRSVTRSFPNNSKQFRVFVSWKHSRRFPIFLGVPASSSQSQTICVILRETAPKSYTSDSIGVQSRIWTHRKTSGTILFGQTRPKWKCLVIMHSTMFGAN